MKGVLKKMNHIYFGKVYPFRLWRYSPFWGLVALRRRIHSSPSSAYLLFSKIRLCEKVWKSLSIPFMALQPLLGPGRPQKTHPFFSFFCSSSLLEK